MKACWRGVMNVALSLVLCGVAEASQESEMLYSKGLLSFHADRNDEALGLFDRAVEADRDDAYALYYRGVTRGRLNDQEGAIQDLRAALERKPDLHEAALELGVALVDTGRGGEAIPWLEQAQRAPELEAQASFFLGIAQLRRGEEEAAEANLERAAKTDPALTLPTLYYRGVAAYQSARWDDAEQRFRAVTSADPSSKLGREAAEFLAVLEGRRGRRFRLYANLALEYDSNVTIAPDDEALNDEFGLSDEDDGRFAATAGATYAPVRTQNVLFNIGYEFFQSFHFQLTDFNLQNHRPSVEVAGRAGDFRFGLLGRYDYYTLDVDEFLQEATAYPWLALYHGARTRLDMWYRMRYRDFLDSDFELRDSVNHSPGIRQAFNLGDWSRSVAIGYRYDREDPRKSSESAEAFGYDGHEVYAGINWLLPADITTYSGYAFRRERYDAESDGRRDNEHHVVVSLGKELTDWLFVGCGYFGTFNDSNQDVFEYDRHIVSASLEVQY